MASDTLGVMSTSTLIEDLGRHRRYADRLNPGGMNVQFARQTQALEVELRKRKVDFDSLLAALPDVAVRPTCRLTPLGDHVVVLPVEAETMTAGGLIVPDSAKEKPREGTVLAVGPGRTEPGIGTVVPAIHVGDTILFGLYSGISVALDGQAVLIMREEDVLGILQPKAVE